jgi:16S rRNA (guanine966-N2)-methyltransferase
MGSLSANERFKRYAISKAVARIIGGEWRGRRLPVIDLPGLRPSGDRSRETLFNWLQAFVPGAACADLFAGSGALGLEAASRGAASVILVEKNSAVVASLDRSINLLRAANARVVERDALVWLAHAEPDSFDIVFVDPPFGEGLAPRILTALDRVGCLREGGFAYFETAVSGEPVAAAPGWTLWREKVIGEVRMQLLKKGDGHAG